jgi:hypothetical protein
MGRLRTLFEKQHSGQAIIIIALGFVGLVAFVGLTTDLALVFVRYSALSRAVDAASIAAANQMRRDTDLVQVNFAARQFIEFHGIDPNDVTVETCLTGGVNAVGEAFAPYMDPQLCVCNPDPTIRPCQADRKLVRVRAQLNSPTTFLRVLGWQDILLEATAISETAALDVVLIMDVSESMLNETSLEDWAKVDLGWGYVPPVITDITGYPDTPPGQFYGTDIDGQPISQNRINGRLDWNDPSSEYYVESFRYKPLEYPVNRGEPRPECRVRYAPASQPVTGWLASADPREYVTALDEFVGFKVPPRDFTGFVPTYNWFGCCNDPTEGGVLEPDPDNPDGYIWVNNPKTTQPDWNFSDLICQPFRGARDATEVFLERLDFERGDRVAYVTFDRRAYILNPYDNDERLDGRSHMIDNRADAVEVLRRFVGVRAEPSFYVFSPAPTGTGFGHYTGFANGTFTDGQPNEIRYDLGPDAGNEAVLYNFPVKGNCDFTLASLVEDHSPYRSLTGGPNNLASSPLFDVMMPDPKQTTPQNWRDFIRDELQPDRYTADFVSLLSYERSAQCRGTNVGAGLRQAQAALLDPRTSRSGGTVWVMVLLGDGAAGASDPVRQAGVKRTETLPYTANPSAVPPHPTGFGVPGEYGAFGLCPFNTTTNPGELVQIAGRDFRFPYCSDIVPETRHMCDFRPLRAWVENDVTVMQDAAYDDSQSVGWNRDRGNLYDVDLADCDPLYDVDDYARDWVDLIALEDFNAPNTQLPVIFTIGFGLDHTTCTGDDIHDCLGEQLLRYIADAGDNNRIDNDWFQEWHEERQKLIDAGQWGASVMANMDGRLDDGSSFAPRGPCQSGPTRVDFSGNLDLMWMRAPAVTSCGNYFVAPNANDLRLVFDEIASRMFSRIAD